ncbi:MAG: Holliday junction resolvase-like protein, partial [Gemmatimonadales bacterium]
MTPLVAIAFALILAVGVWLGFLLWKARYTRLVRRDAMERSLAVTTGQALEQVAAYLPGFRFNPRDARFLGSPVDFVVFDGLTDGAVRRVVFVEVKSGDATLTTRERRVRDAVQ